MKKNYEEPFFAIVTFRFQDVLSVSNTPVDPDGPLIIGGGDWGVGEIPIE